MFSRRSLFARLAPRPRGCPLLLGLLTGALLVMVWSGCASGGCIRQHIRCCPSLSSCGVSMPASPSFCQPQWSPTLTYTLSPCGDESQAPEVYPQVSSTSEERPPLGARTCDVPTGHETFFGYTPPLVLNSPWLPGSLYSGTIGGIDWPVIPSFELSSTTGGTVGPFPEGIVLGTINPPPPGKVRHNPEPASLVMLGLGAGGLAVYHGLIRRKRRITAG